MKKKDRKNGVVDGGHTPGSVGGYKKDTSGIPYVDLPETVVFSGYVVKSGGRFIITIPEGFRDLCHSEEYGREAVNVALTFPYRRIAKLQKKINDVKNGVI